MCCSFFRRTSYLSVLIMVWWHRTIITSSFMTLKVMNRFSCRSFRWSLDIFLSIFFILIIKKRYFSFVNGLSLPGCFLSMLILFVRVWIDLEIGQVQQLLFYWLDFYFSLRLLHEENPYQKPPVDSISYALNRLWFLISRMRLVALV